MRWKSPNSLLETSVNKIVDPGENMFALKSSQVPSEFFFGHASNSNLSYGQLHISHGGPSRFNHLRFERSPSIELLRKQARTCSRLREPTIIKFFAKSPSLLLYKAVLTFPIILI